MSTATRTAAPTQTRRWADLCVRCGTDTLVRECPDWCVRISSGCYCHQPTCGECMRHMGTTGSGFGSRYAR